MDFLLSLCDPGVFCSKPFLFQRSKLQLAADPVELFRCRKTGSVQELEKAGPVDITRTYHFILADLGIRDDLRQKLRKLVFHYLPLKFLD